MERAANSTPIVLLLSALNSLVVKRISKLDLPTPESPIKTTKNGMRKVSFNTPCPLLTFEQVIVVFVGHAV